MTTRTITLYLAVNQEAETCTSLVDFDDAIRDLKDSYVCDAIRTVRLDVTVELPKTETVTVPAQTQEPVEAVAR